MFSQSLRTSVFAALCCAMLIGSNLAAADDDQPIDFQRARQLFHRSQQGQKLNDEEQAYLDRAKRERQKGNARPTAGPSAGGPAPKPTTSTGLVPLTELGTNKYKGEDGGLYGGGSNEPPSAHAAAARRAIDQIVPRNSSGAPASDGKIGFVSISMSNATMEFSAFVKMANADSDKAPQVAVVDCAQGGQAMAQWTSPDARPWSVAMSRLDDAGVSPEQVQVAWIKLANVRPTGNLHEHGRQLQKDTQLVLQNAKAKFPNLQVAYLDSRIYAGYATTNLNPEPYAYEGAFVVRWLIEGQIAGKPELNYDAEKGSVKSPVLLWGPYLWADGIKPRKIDDLVWKKEDLTDRDGTHPSDLGREKVARLLLNFVHTNPFAAPWYLAKGRLQAGR